MYDTCIQQYRARHRWMAFIDADEFFVLRDARAPDLPALLAEYEQFGALAVNWQARGARPAPHMRMRRPLCGAAQCDGLRAAAHAHGVPRIASRLLHHANCALPGRGCGADRLLHYRWWGRRATQRGRVAARWRRTGAACPRTAWPTGTSRSS